jgi:hypothetical protein
LEMINSVQSGLAVLATNCLTSFSISLNIRPWGDGSSRPGRIRSVLRPRSRALPIFLEGGAAADNAGCPLRAMEGPNCIHGSPPQGFVDHVPGPTKLTSWDGNSSPERRFPVFPENLKPSDGDGPYRGRDGSRDTWSSPSPSKRNPIASSSSARMLNIGDASKIDEQEQALRRITSILAERPEKTLDPTAPNGILQPT